MRQGSNKTWWQGLTALVCLLICVTASAAVSSGAFIASPDGDFLYSANLEAASVSRIAVNDPDKRIERHLGRDVRRLALAPDAGLLAVTDDLAEKVWLLDADTLEVKHTLSLEKKPFGVVYDARNRLFWVTLYESSELVGVDLEGRIRQRLDTADTPRGLALLSDGRLLVTHAMTGQVSLYDTTRLPPKPIKRIDLAIQQNPDESVSQGLPRRLDDIAVSPDETVAWLPHVLWNFDHPFQFQSTVFPAISELALTPGKEREIVPWRKQLFKQINLQNTRNRTLITSNPTDAEFSASGKKVYVTMAASEDVLVFDRSRGVHDPEKLGHSKRGRGTESGAQATQLVRDIPGDNPRGLVALDDKLYVQSAMSLDVTRLNTGGDSPFARVRVDAPHWAKLVAEDPLPAPVRRGKTIFNDANTAESPDYPMAGDFWMSCDSCHVDGFNFTNRYLMAAGEANPHGPNRSPNTAITGHAGLEHMVGGDFVGDYIRMIQDTQGGLGEDTRDSAKPVDPDHPPAVVKKAMDDLHAYVTRRQNLPYVSTWLRFDRDERFVHPEEWLSSASCAGCHSTIYRQWANSNHHFMGASNPYYRVVEDIAGESEGEGFRAWCLGCHNPQRLSVGKKTHADDNRMFDKDGKTLLAQYKDDIHATDEGTSCLFCHRVTRLEDAGGNAAFTVNLKDRPTYPGETSGNPMLRWFSERLIGAKPKVHADSYSQPFYDDARFCGNCHDEFSPGPGSKIVGTYEAWKNSSFNDPARSEKQRSCIDCHMHGDISRIGEPVPGRSTDGGPMKENMVSHQFTGANYHLAGLRSDEQRRMSIELLRTSAKLEERLDDGRLVVRVRNVGAAHKLPTGVSDFRQLWLQVTVTDAGGRVLVHSGFPDADGNLPEDSRFFRKVMGDENGQPVKLHFWRFARMLEDTRIPADGYRDEAFDLPADVEWPVTVDSKLLFRIYPQWITDRVQQEFPDLPTPDIITLNHIQDTLGAAHAD